jgi:NAD(P)-dependent dehydrogenase (short-subunit alcohol dehydrogenase family)
VLSWDVTIDIIINNAVIFGMKNFTTNKEGYELTMVVAYLAHFLLTNLLKPKLVATPSSISHIRGDIEFQDP